MRVGVKPGQWGWSFSELVASWEAAEEAGFGVLSCFDHVTAAPAGVPAWNAPSLLTAMGGRTERIALAVDVLNVSLRHPFLLAAQVAVAQAASGGRVEVGLGAGSAHFAPFDHDALGRPFRPLAERVERLERCCRVLPALWRGETVTDPALDLHEGSLGPIGIEVPPIVVGGRSDRTMTVAAKAADGWNGVESDPARFAARCRRLDELCVELGRDRPIARTAQVFVRDVEPSRLRAVRHGMEEAGADTVTFVLTDERGPDAVLRLAEAVL